MKKYNISLMVFVISIGIFITTVFFPSIKIERYDS